MALIENFLKFVPKTHIIDYLIHGFPTQISTILIEDPNMSLRNLIGILVMIPITTQNLKTSHATTVRKLDTSSQTVLNSRERNSS